MVHVSQTIEFRLPAGAFDLLVGQGDEVVDMAQVTILQQRVAGMAARVGVTDMVSRQIAAVALQTIEDVQERDVGFGDGFVKPVFFKEIVVLGMADEGQVGVERPGTGSRGACQEILIDAGQKGVRRCDTGGVRRFKGLSAPLAARTTCIHRSLGAEKQVMRVAVFVGRQAPQPGRRYFRA